MKSPLLTVVSLAAGSASTTKGSTEVDVIFPRNDTFAPMPLMPVVFAIQNPAVARHLNLRLDYRVIPHGQPNATTGFERVRLNALPGNDTTFYAHGFVADMLGKEGTWEFFWQLRWNNCTAADQGGGTPFTRDTEEPVNSFVFTTQRDGREPDLVALSGSGSDRCGKAQGIGFEVLGVLDVPPPQNADLLTSCAHVAVPAPTPTPCSASMAPEAAESISSRITQAACLAATPAVSCPPEGGAAGQRATVNLAAAALSLVSVLSILSF